MKTIRISIYLNQFVFDLNTMSHAYGQHADYANVR